MLIGQEVTVLGAGIGGLTAALALARRGARVRVLEQAPELAEIGAGLQISPNGVAVLSALGVADAVAQGAVRGRAVELIDGARGARVLRLDLGALRSPHPWLLVHRADLVAALEAACGQAGVRFDFATTVTGLEVAADEVHVTLATGDVVHAPRVVAADGVRSLARRCLEPDVAPRFTGQVAWRALVRAGDARADGTVRVFLGAGRHLVAYPLRGGAWLNIVAVEERAAWAAEGWTRPDDPSALRAAFAGFGGEVSGWLAQVRDVHLWGLHKHPVAPVWHRGRLAILGDAAHATLPFLAQGACMAIEDAWVLAEALAQDDTPETAFAAYQACRIARCRRIVAAADRNAAVYHLGGVLRPLAHGVLRLGGRIAPDAPLRRFDWLYGHDVTHA